jgi:hypothetical protein
MAGGRASGSATKPRTGGRGAAGAPARSKGVPKDGWYQVDLSNPGERAAWLKLQQRRRPDVDEAQLLDSVRKIQRSQPGSGGFASDEEPPKEGPAQSPPPAPARSGKTGGSLPSPSLRPPRRLSAADGGGFLLGLVLFGIAQSYIRYGTTGVRSWFAAKFLNRPDAKIVAAEGQRGIAAARHGQLTAPGQPYLTPAQKALGGGTITEGGKPLPRFAGPGVPK